MHNDRQLPVLSWVRIDLMR